MNFCDLTVHGVAELQAYIPGKPIEELQRQYGLRDIIKLASNENPLGPSKAAVAAVAQTTKELARYPDGNGFNLKLALAEKYQLTEAQITLGNGSNDVLELVARAFASSGDEVIYSQHAFAVYALATKAVGATAVVTEAKDYGHDLQAMLAAITPRTKVIFIANPNNPTGTWLAPDALRSFLTQVPERVIVVLDEAYIEYLTEAENTVAWLADFANLVITRTFSKAYGLAGLRVGYALSNPQVADLLNRIRQPFNVNQLAQAAAVAALGDEAYLQTSRELNQAGMKQLTAAFDGMGLSYIPSTGNFVSVDVGTDAAAVNEALLQHGIIVRPVANYGLPQHLRISIGLESENARVLHALAEILGRQLND